MLCAAGYTVKWLLRMIIKKGIAFLEAFFTPAKARTGQRPRSTLDTETTDRQAKALIRLLRAIDRQARHHSLCF